jgi:hypothetical protein
MAQHYLLDHIKTAINSESNIQAPLKLKVADYADGNRSREAR